MSFRSSKARLSESHEKGVSGAKRPNRGSRRENRVNAKHRLTIPSDAKIVTLIHSSPSSERRLSLVRFRPESTALGNLMSNPTTEAPLKMLSTLFKITKAVISTYHGCTRPSQALADVQASREAARVKADNSSREQIERLRKDGELVAERRSRLETQVAANGGADASRLLGVVSAFGDANLHLANAIPKLLDQCAETGRRADILLGLNNGFNADESLAVIGRRPDAEIMHVYTDPRVDPTVPSAVKTANGQEFNIGQPSDHTKHRVIVIHQAASPMAAGKIRMLGDIYGLVNKSITNGWTPPLYMLVFDAETQLLRGQRGRRPNLYSNGLAPLLSALDKDLSLDLVGSRNYFVVYNNGVPDYDVPIGPIHEFMQLAHSSEGYRWLPGGGTVGKTIILTAILQTIAERQPGSAFIDTVTTVIAKAIGYKSIIITDVVSTNNAPPRSEKSRSRAQFVRWTAGYLGMIEMYGDCPAVRNTVAPTLIVNIKIGLSQSLINAINNYGWSTTFYIAEVIHDLISLTATLPEYYLIVRRKAALIPGNPLDPNASTAWISPGVIIKPPANE